MSSSIASKIGLAMFLFYHQRRARVATAVDATRGAVIPVSSPLRPALAALTPKFHALDSRVILVAENAEHISDSVAGLLDGVICRSIAGPDLVDCIRRVGRGQRCL